MRDKHSICCFVPGFRARSGARELAPVYAKTAAWTNEADRLRGQAVLLTDSGDRVRDIRSLRYLPLLADVARQVTLVLHSDIARLAASVDRRVRVLRAELHEVRGNAMPLDALEELFARIDELEQLCAFPYINVGYAELMACEDRLARIARGRPRVALATSSALDRRLHALEDIPGIAWFTEAMASGQAGIRLDDLLQRAAFYECMDLVITAEPCVAYLVGALGKPVWWVGAKPLDGFTGSGLVAPYPGASHVGDIDAPGIRRLSERIRSWYNDHVDALIQHVCAMAPMHA